MASLNPAVSPSTQTSGPTLGASASVGALLPSSNSANTVTPRPPAAFTPGRSQVSSSSSTPMMPQPPAVVTMVQSNQDARTPAFSSVRPVTPARTAPAQPHLQGQETTAPTAAVAAFAPGMVRQSITPRVVRVSAGGDKASFVASASQAPGVLMTARDATPPVPASPSRPRPLSPIRSAIPQSLPAPAAKAGLPLVAFGASPGAETVPAPWAQPRRISAPGQYQHIQPSPVLVSIADGLGQVVAQRALLKTSSAGALIRAPSPIPGEGSPTVWPVEPVAAKPRAGQTFGAFDPLESPSGLIGPRLARCEMELSEFAHQRQALANTVAENTKKMADMVAEAIRDIGVYDVLAVRVDALEDSFAKAHRRIEEASGQWQTSQDRFERRLRALEKGWTLSPSITGDDMQDQASQVNLEARVRALEGRLVAGGAGEMPPECGVGRGAAADVAAVVERLTELETKICEDLPGLIQQCAIASAMTENTKARVSALEEQVGVGGGSKLEASCIEAVHAELVGRIDQASKQCAEVFQDNGLRAPTLQPVVAGDEVAAPKQRHSEQLDRGTSTGTSGQCGPDWASKDDPKILDPRDSDSKHAVNPHADDSFGPLDASATAHMQDPRPQQVECGEPSSNGICDGKDTATVQQHGLQRRIGSPSPSAVTEAPALPTFG